jgi:hypothetical protein
MQNRVTKFICGVLILCVGLSASAVIATAESEVDRNIAIIFPPDLMEYMIDQTTPTMMDNLKFSSDADRNKTQNEVDTFHHEFLRTFNTLVRQSLKENFTAQEIAVWASFETTPLGEKTMLWLKTKYPGILNQAMEQPMQNLYKSMAQ